jgi:hypothetical protein
MLAPLLQTGRQGEDALVGARAVRRDADDADLAARERSRLVEHHDVELARVLEGQAVSNE